MSARARAQRWGAAIVMGLVLLSAVGGAGAQQSDADLRRERERLRAERAEMAAEIDVARAETDELLEALAALEEHVRAEEAHLDDAERAVAAAEEQVEEALAALDAAEVRIEELRDAMARVAIDAYVNPPEQENLSIVLTGELGTAPERQALLEMSATSQADVMERYRAALEDREIQRETAEAARGRAEDARAEVEIRLQSVADARDAQALVAAQAQQQVDEMLHAAAELEASEQQITGELARREAERERQRLAELQRQLEAANRRRGPVNVPGRGTIQLVTVGGITVNAQIADQLQRMLDHAARDGIVLSGGGWRDSAQQIALRRSHCGTSQYAVYQMPAGSCRPPTARPGTSLHEQGLAIDFRANGRSMTSRSSPGFQWLARHAASYGFYNLPSEPWHWSTTGG